VFSKTASRGSYHRGRLAFVQAIHHWLLPSSLYEHLDRYLDEFEFRFNNRDNPYLFRDTLLRLLASANLEYKELTKEKAA
jgi:hypothetical protein